MTLNFYSNGTMIPQSDCTLTTCSQNRAQVDYIPNLPGNLFFLAFFVTLFWVQIILGPIYRTWSYSFCAVAGLAFEVVGYVSRIEMHYNPFPKGPFLLNIVGLTIGPTFLSAALYLSIGRIIIVFGREHASLPLWVYTWIFIGSDTVCLVLQGVGGFIASSADTISARDLGIHIMLAGLVIQVLSLAAFMFLCVLFASKVRQDSLMIGKSRNRIEMCALPRERSQSNDITQVFHSPSGVNVIALRQRPLFKAFIACIGIATPLIFIRSVYRVVELSEGFQSKLANNETLFYILDGMLVLIASIGLSAVHAGPALDEKGNWARIVAIDPTPTQQKLSFTRFIGWPEENMIEDEAHFKNSSFLTRICK